jgi:hypothetical protein
LLLLCDKQSKNKLELYVKINWFVKRLVVDNDIKYTKTRQLLWISLWLVIAYLFLCFKSVFAFKKMIFLKFVFCFNIFFLFLDCFYVLISKINFKK